jgi:peptidoglycan/xylan/chitin deacetylase (PgdA/CDA1 family)
MRKRALTGLFALALAIAGAETEFSGLDLSDQDRLLFSARADVPGGASYRSVFRAKLPDGPVEQLTFYPERMQFVDDGKALLLQNRFGVFKSDQSFAGLSPVKGYPSFIQGSQVQDGRLIATQASPDGRFLLSVRPTLAAHGRLVLQDALTGTETAVSPKVEYSLNAFPAIWAPLSNFFVYSAGGNLYYFSIEQYSGKRVPDERYRSLGPGTIASVRWSADGYLYFIKGRNLYRADPREFFTRTLYSPVLHTGDPVGEVPFAFDSNFDSFYVSPTAAYVLIVKGGRSLFIHEVRREGSGPAAGAAVMMPYLRLPANSQVERVVWPAFGPITVFAHAISGGERALVAFRLTDPELDSPSFRADASSRGDAPLPRGVETLKQSALALDLANARDIAASPDGSLLAIVLEDSVRILSYEDLAEKASFKAVSPRLAIFRSKNEIALGGDAFVEMIDIRSGARRLVALSQADIYGFSVATGLPVARAGGKQYALGPSGTWAESSAWDAAPPKTSSDNYRVYLDEISRGSYRNAVMVRAVKTLRTSNLIVPPSATYAPFPLKDEDRKDGVFNHGSRLRRREVAVTFDAVDNDEGLTQALNVLEDYGIKATFFLNGEFIRRHPASAAVLADSGHEIGSMFFATFNLTDKGFGVDAEFIRRGLARNEDDYFSATGKELSAIWHAPFYTVNSDIVAWAGTLNYSYVGRDVDPLDWVTAMDQYRFPGTYLDSAAIVERSMKMKKPGSIIPVRLGIPEGGRNDYLYHRLDLLFNALIAEGYSVVPVSTLMDHAK